MEKIEKAKKALEEILRKYQRIATSKIADKKELDEAMEVSTGIVYEIVELNTTQLKELCSNLAGYILGRAAAKGKLKEEQMFILDQIEEIKKIEEDAGNRHMWQAECPYCNTMLTAPVSAKTIICPGCSKELEVT